MFKYLSIFFCFFCLLSCEKEDDELNDSRDRFLGEWLVTEGTGANQVSFDVEVKKDYNDDTFILIYNFHDIGDDLFVKVKVSTVAAQSLILDAQEVETYFFDNGSGNLQSDNTIDFNYRFDDGNGYENIVAKFNR
jgi:hypothetical protein